MMNTKEQLQSCRRLRRQLDNLYKYVKENAPYFNNDLLVGPYKIFRHIVTNSPLTYMHKQTVLNTKFDGHFTVTASGTKQLSKRNLMSSLGEEHVTIDLNKPKLTFRPVTGASQDVTRSFTLVVKTPDGIEALGVDVLYGIDPPAAHKPKFVIRAFLTYLRAYRDYLQHIIKHYLNHVNDFRKRVTDDDANKKHIASGPYSFASIFGQNLKDFLKSKK